MSCLKQNKGRAWRLCLAAGLTVSSGVLGHAQQKSSPPPPVAESSSTGASNGKKSTHANDFVIRGTVFTEKGLSFPGVELRIRVAGQKKYRWETYTNSRGEFAVRVAQGADYEMLVHVKGFADQTKTVDTKNGESEESIVFRMAPIGSDKK